MSDSDLFRVLGWSPVDEMDEPGSPLTDEEIADLKNRLTDRDGVIGLSD